MPVAANRRSVIDYTAVVVVGFGAALGGVARLFVTGLVVARAGAGAAPLATLAINVSGSLLIGVIAGALQARADLSPLWRLFLATGILGGFTTFSTFSLDVVTLGTAGAALAASYAFGSVALGIACAFAGLAIGRAL